MRICRRCGVYAPPEAGLCEWCSGSLRDATLEVEPPQYRTAAVRIEWTHGGCGHRTPIDGLPEDGRVVCGWCDGRETLDERAWKQILDRAHAVADLLGERPEGFECSEVAIDEINPFAELGHRQSVICFARDEADALPGLPDALRARVAPGVPLDPEDSGPVSVEPIGAGAVRVCSVSEIARYDVPPLHLAAYPQLVGIIAHDHRTDRVEPTLGADPSGGWVCPACGGQVSRSDGSRFLVRCGACGTVASVPAVLRHRRVRTPRPATLWVLFDGPSPERRRLERHPAAGAQPRADDRPLESMPLAADSPVGKVLQVLYVALVPTILLAIAGLIRRGPELWAALQSP